MNVFTNRDEQAHLVRPEPLRNSYSAITYQLYDYDSVSFLAPNESLLKLQQYRGTGIRVSHPLYLTRELRSAQEHWRLFPGYGLGVLSVNYGLQFHSYIWSEKLLKGYTWKRPSYFVLEEHCQYIKKSNPLIGTRGLIQPPFSIIFGVFSRN